MTSNEILLCIVNKEVKVKSNDLEMYTEEARTTLYNIILMLEYYKLIVDMAMNNQKNRSTVW